MVRIAFLALLAPAIVGCSNPLPFGPGRVAISLDQAKVLVVDHATLFPNSPKGPKVPDQHEALQLVISSETELLGYFAEWNRQVRVRCAVEGNANGKSYSGAALGPVPEVRQPSKPYRYIIYSFIGLKANDVQYERGSPATTLNLRTDAFETLRCHFVGVTKAPVLFPRSNDVVVPASTFRTLLRQENIQ